MTFLGFYLLKVIVCSGLLFLYYWFFLRNQLFHQWNRFYLLFSVIISLFLPLVEINYVQPADVPPPAFKALFIGQSADHYLQEFVISNESSWDSDLWLIVMYGLVAFLFLLSIVYSIWQIISLIRSHTVQLVRHVKFITTKAPGAPFSFLNYIFWNDDIPLQTPTGEQIFQHELVHVQDRHTWDKLFMRFVSALYWCNPFFWLIRKELDAIHEFIADQKAVGRAGTEALAVMILQTVYPQQFLSLTNPFFQTPIKRRIFMLTKIKNPRVVYFSRVLALPLISLLALSFTMRTQSSQAIPSQDQHFPNNQQDTLPSEGKSIASIQVDAKKRQLTVTYKDGRKESFTEKEAHEKGLISKGDYGHFKNGNPPSGSDSELRLNTDTPPLFILEGEEVSKEFVEQLDPNAIASVNVLKDHNAEEKYGDKGKNGVVEITLKKSVAVESPVTANLSHLSAVKDTTKKPEPIFQKVEMEASVSTEEWTKFLKTQLSPIVQKLSKTVPEGSYTAYVQFIVDKDGSLSDIKITKDPGYGIGAEIMGIMKYSPKWAPAQQNHKIVKSYHTQPISLVIRK